MADQPKLNRPKALTAGLVVPDTRRRRIIATALAGSQLVITQECDAYPPSDSPELKRLKDCPVVIVDLDDSVDDGLAAIEAICALDPSITVMAYSSSNDTGLMRRSMQAGAREFLVEPLLPAAIEEAFTRTSSRRSAKETPAGKMLVFVPSKGGVGVTTMAANFALALVKESGARVVVVDMDFQLGEIALGLGMTTTFSVVDALMNASRLDKEFLSTLIVRHSSGLAVLSSPEYFNFFHSPVDEGADKLFRILREEFDYIVVDTGTCHGHIQEALFVMADRLYLVAEMSFPALRNAHRLLEYLATRNGCGNVEVVLNRFNARHGDIDEESAVKALGRPIAWRIPNAYAVAKNAQDSGVPLALDNSPITRALVQMAKSACGKPLTPQKRASSGFSFFGLRALAESTDN